MLISKFHKAQTPYLTQKAFLLSILCHVLFLQVFIFTFSVKPSSHKPFFVFLGSILEKQSFAIPNLQTGSPQKNSNDLKLPTLFQSSAFDPSDNKGVEKPPMSKNQTTAKPPLPPQQEFPDKESFSQKNLIEKLGIEPTVPQRTPLQLYLE